MSMLHMKYTDKKGKSWVQWHTCWDHALFEQSQQAAYDKEGGSAQVITEAHYRAEKSAERRH